MGQSKLLAVLFLIAIVSTSRADEKPVLPAGVPPTLATFVGVDPKTQILQAQLRTVLFSIEYKNGKAGAPPQRTVRRVYGTKLTDLSLKSARFSEASGKKIEVKDVVSRLKAGDTIVVSTDGQEIEPAYLRVLAKTAIVVVDDGYENPPADDAKTFTSAVAPPAAPPAESKTFPPSVDYQSPEVLPRHKRVDR